MAYENFRQKIINLQSDLNSFNVEFLDRDGFRQFTNRLRYHLTSPEFTDICITGYFSETIRESLEGIIRPDRVRVRLICPYFPIKAKRDRNNLQVLKKLSEAGAEIRVNDRLHARFLVGHFGKHPERDGLLVIGSFDFNTECIGLERYDAGIKTKHPDLVNSAVQLFDQIWSDDQSEDLLIRYEKELN